MATVNANVVADLHAPQNQHPVVTQSSNGTTQVDIQTPSAGGVSRNQFSQFDVDNNGVILNNSQKHTQTQLGDMVAGNQLLTKGEARVILNEVNSSHPSQLNGFIEVAGKQAQVVIANPAGITCDGCGFINANRSTLTTGQVHYNGQEISGYQVNDGTIRIQGKGLDDRRSGYTELLARAVDINADLWANELQVVAGRNQISPDLAKIEPLADNRDDQSKVAIDVSSLGGMYAERIHLVGTEKGLGVHSAGKIGAQAGSVVISADGDIENQGQLISEQHIQLSSNQDIINTGLIRSKQDTRLTSQGSIINQRDIESSDNITLIANKDSDSKNLVENNYLSTGQNYPDETSKISNYDKAMSSPSALPDLNAGKGTAGVNVSSLNPNEIRFSQNTVSYKKIERGNTDLQYTYDDLVTSMKTNGWKGEPVDVIKMPDGKFTSIDNTRIAAARAAGIDIKANVRNFDDNLSAAEISRFSDPKKGFIPKTWGEAITGRIDKQSGGFRKNNPYGSSNPPRITGKPKD